MNWYTKMKNSRYLPHIINAVFVAVLMLYPMRHVNIGLDLWDTGYNYSNFEYMGLKSMDSMWFFSTYLSTAIGHLFTLLPFGKTLIGMNVYTSLIPGALAAFSYFFCTKNLKMDRFLVFLGEMTALNLTWCPSAVLYDMLTYLFMHLAIVFLYVGMASGKKFPVLLSGSFLGLNVFVRFSNLPEILFFVAIWAYCIVCCINRKKEGKAAVREELGRAFAGTGLFAGGYLGAIGLMAGYIGIRYGLSEYISGIKRLFDIPKVSHHYSSKEMLAALIFGYLRNTKWVLLLLAFSAVAALFGFLAGKAGNKGKKAAAGLLWVMSPVTAVASVVTMYLMGMFAERVTDGASLVIPGTVLTYLMMLLGLYVIFSGFGRFSKEEKLIAGLVIMMILVTPIGSNNGIVLTFNNLFIALPWFIYTCIKAFGKPAVAAGGGVIAAFCAVCFVRFAIFGANYVFVDAMPATETDHTVDGPETLRGVRMSEERARAVSGLYEFVSGKGLYGNSEIITYGYIPAVSFYLQMPPAFNSWADLESYGDDTMRNDISEYLDKAESGEGRLPLIVISTQYSEAMASEGSSGIAKIDCIKELIRAGGYLSEYKNELFEVYCRTDSGEK